MLYQLNVILQNSKNYCNNYLKSLISKYLNQFIQNEYDYLLSLKILENNKYLINYNKIINTNKHNEYNEEENLNNIIDEILSKIEKHIKNIYPECGSFWNLKYQVFYLNK